MTRAKQTGETARQTTAASTGPTAATDKGASMAPPPYGIAFVDRALQAPANHTGMPDALKAGIEQLSGLSLDAVKVHYNASQPGQLGAAAFAQGQHIHLAPGQAHHLPHEAWHVVQQAQGRVLPNARLDGGPALNDELPLELEAEAMGAKALSVGTALVAGGAPAAALAPVNQAPGAATGGGAGVIQRWPEWLDRLRGKDGPQRLASEDDTLTEDVKQMGRRAQFLQATIEARRRDKVRDGLGQTAEEGGKVLADAAGIAAIGLPAGTIYGAVRTAQSTVSAANRSYRKKGTKRSVVKTVAKGAAIEGGNQAAGNIPVVGGLIGAGQGLATAATGILETDASRLAEKQRAVDSLLDDSALAEQARERLEAARQRKPGAELEPAQQRRLTKGLHRYDQALAAAKKWQRGKGAKGVTPLLSRHASDQLDE